MKKFFVANLFFLVTLNILIKSFWILGIDRGVQNAVDAESYGMYFVILNFTYLFNIILDFGIANYNNRTIAQNPHLLRKYFGSIVPLKMLLSVVYMLIVLVAGWLNGYSSHMVIMLFWLCVTQVLSSFVSYFRSILTALFLFKTDSVISVLDRSLLILICSFFLWNTRLRESFCIDYFVYIQVLTMFVTCMTAMIICLVKTGRIRLKFNKPLTVLIIREGWPYAMLGLLMACYNRLDSVMLTALLDDGGRSAAIYASGFRLVDSANMVSLLFSVILLPLFSRMIKEKTSVEPIVSTAWNLVLVMSVCFIFVSVVYSTELMTLMYNKHISESADIYRILAFCFLPISVTYVFGTLLTANGSMKALNIIAFAGMVMNIVLNLLFIPKWQQNGAALTSLVTQSLTAFMQMAYAFRLFKLRLTRTYLCKIVLFLLLNVIIYVALHKIDILWIFRVLISLMLSLLSAFATKLFSLRDVKQMLS